MKFFYGCDVDPDALLPDCIIIDSNGAVWQQDQDGWWVSGVVRNEYPGLSLLQEQRGPLVTLDRVGRTLTAEDVRIVINSEPLGDIRPEPYAYESVAKRLNDILYSKT